MLSSSEKSVRNIPMTDPRIKILALLRISFAKSENMTPRGGPVWYAQNSIELAHLFQ